MDKSQLQRQASSMRRALFDQGYLDEQFIALEDLQDDANPNFDEEIVTLFYRESARMVYNIEQALYSRPMDFAKLEEHVHKFKGSSSSIGAKKVQKECTKFNEYCAAENADGCVRTFQQIKEEYSTLKNKLETYFQLAREAAQT